MRNLIENDFRTILFMSLYLLQSKKIGVSIKIKLLENQTDSKLYNTKSNIIS